MHQRNEKLQRCFSWTIMEECLPPDIVEEYREAFKMLDRKKVGKISIRDVSTMVCSIGIYLTEAHLIEFVGNVVELKDIDLTENCLRFPHFLATMTSIITNCVPENEAKRIFQEFDRDGDGYITANELRDLLSRLGDDVTDDQIQEMIAEADKDGDGMVSLQEFINVMNSAHTSHNSDDDVYPLPRILTENEEEISNSILNEESCTSTDISSPDTNGDDLSELLPSSFDSKNSFASSELLSTKFKSNTRKRKKSIIDWLRRSSKESDQMKLADTENEGFSSSSCSVASDIAPTIPAHLRERRRSSITRTLRSGKDALVATAKTIRKFSG